MKEYLPQKYFYCIVTNPFCCPVLVFSDYILDSAEGFKRRTSLTNISLNILIKLEDNLSFLTNWKTCCATKKKCFDTWQIETDVIETTLRGRSQTTFANWANFWPPTSVYIGWHLDYHLPTCQCWHATIFSLILKFST